MRKTLFIAIALMVSFMTTNNVNAQVPTRISERVQQTFVNTRDINLPYLLRIHSTDIFTTEVKSVSLRAVSYTNVGNLEILVRNRTHSRIAFRNFPTEQTIYFPSGLRLSDISIRVYGEVHIDTVVAYVIDLRWAPAPPRPIPPSYPAPIPRPMPPRHGPAPRPMPPRHEPAPRPMPPRHEPAPRPRPPRHEPAPRPRPPRHEPAPRPMPPRHEPAPRPAPPRHTGPGPRPQPPRGPRR